RKDTWARYPAPKKIPVVYEPDPDQPDPKAKAGQKLPWKQVAATIAGLDLSQHKGPDAGKQRGWKGISADAPPLDLHIEGLEPEFPFITGVLSSEASPNQRMQALMFQSEDLRQIQHEWQRAWMIDQPAHMKIDRIHGSIGPQGLQTHLGLPPAVDP